MKEKAIILLHPDDTRRGARLVAGKPFSWLYLGQDVGQREAISRKLGRDSYYSLGSRLQETAIREKQPFLDFIAGLGAHQKNRRHWWASNIAYKSPLTSDLFLHWCYAAVLEQVGSEEEWLVTKPLLVFIENRWLYRYLWRRHRPDRDRFRFLSRKSVLPELAGMVMRGIAVRGLVLARVGWQRWRFRVAPPGSKAAEGIYIHSEVSARSFPGDGQFQERNFGRLTTVLNDARRRISYVTSPFMAARLKRQCLSSDRGGFVFLDRYATTGNLLRSFLTSPAPSCPRVVTGKFPSVRVLLQHEIARDLPVFAKTILHYLCFKDWLKDISPQGATVIYPFENQPWEKMLCLAARERGAGIRLIGFQHAGVASLLLNYFPGKGETDIMPLPQQIITSGEYTRQLFAEGWDDKVELKNGGALRYEYMHQDKPAPAAANRDIKTILVAFTYSPNLTAEMLIALFDAFAGEKEAGIEFVLKFHPDVPLDYLNIKLPAWPERFRVVDKPVSELLKQADLLVYSSSTVGLETYLAGIPVIRYHSEHMLGLDPMDALDGSVIQSCSRDNMKEVVLSVLSGSVTSQLSNGSIKPEYFFAPPDFELWKKVVAGE